VKQKKTHGFTPVKQKKVLVSLGRQGKLRCPSEFHGAGKGAKDPSTISRSYKLTESDLDNCLLLCWNRCNLGFFLILGPSFWGQKQGFKDFESFTKKNSSSLSVSWPL